MFDQKEKIDELFKKWDHTDSPGCSLAIVKGDRIVYKKGYGVANLEHQVVNTPSTVFYIASTAKQFAAFSIALLEEAGQLSIEDDVRKYVTELPDYGATIRVKHLIHHTSGLRDYLMLNALSGRHYDELITQEDAHQFIMQQKALNFQAGSEYLYSNSGYFLLSQIVRRVTGKTLRQFAKENIFHPLGMRHTHYHDDRTEPVEKRATAYRLTPEGAYRISVPGLETIGSGGLYSTVEDLFLWDQNFVHNKLGLGHQSLIERILTTGVLNDGTVQDYAFGLIVKDYKGVKMIGHSGGYGGYGGYSAEFIRFPEHSLTIICLSNHSNLSAPRLALRVADILLGKYLTEELDKPKQIEPVTLTDVEIAKIAGIYHNPHTGQVLQLDSVNGQVAVDLGDASLTLTPVSPMNFVLLDAPFELKIRFEEVGDKFVAHARTDDRDSETLYKLKTVLPSEKELEQLCGDYHSPELSVTGHIFLENAQPFLKVGRHKIRLMPGEKDMYITEHAVLDKMVLTLQRKENAICSFALDAGRVRNIQYSREIGD